MDCSNFIINGKYPASTILEKSAVSHPRDSIRDDRGVRKVLTDTECTLKPPVTYPPPPPSFTPVDFVTCVPPSPPLSSFFKAQAREARRNRSRRRSPHSSSLASLVCVILRHTPEEMTQPRPL